MATRTLTVHPAVTSRATVLRLVLAVGFAAATAAAAQIRIPLPFTPVPITGQTAVVLLSGAALGARWGTFSMGLYLLAGALGLPWIFSGDEAGLAPLLGATGGYLLGFALVPPLVGRALPPGSGAARASLVMLAASGVILLWGMLQLAVVLRLPLGRAFAMGVAPFLVGDVVKVAIAALAFRAGRPWIARVRRTPTG
ncbi:MAG TPA: biotin transporter BioY [Gemmatimonadota bacterium]|jgi:biotin transport system substrate-specific component